MLVRYLAILLLALGAAAQSSTSSAGSGTPSLSAAQSSTGSAESGTPSSSAAPSSSSSSSSSSASSTENSSALTSGALPSSTHIPDPDENPETACSPDHYVSKPFCKPSNDTTWRTTGEYYVVWDNDIWRKNSSVVLTLNYKNPGDNGLVAGTWKVANAFGFHIIKPDTNWLLNQTARNSGNDEKLDNQTLFLTISSDDSTSSANNFSGPTVVLTDKAQPSPTDTSPNNRPPPSTLGLAIGLPLLFAFVFVGLCGTHFCMRTRRQVGPIAIGGGRRHFRRKRGYSGRTARRMRATMGGEAGYRDEPNMPGGRDMDIERTPEDRRAEWELAQVAGGRI